MKKKYSENSEEENEFDVDEPEEIQNNASDDDWTPDKDTSGGRRTSSRLRNIPKSRAPIIDASSTDDEENSDDSGGSSKRKSKGRGRGRPFLIKKQKVSSSTTSSPIKVKTENGGKSVNSDSEPSSTTTNTTSLNNTNNSAATSPSGIKTNNKDFTSGAFVVLKSDAANLEAEPPLWKIDGKALLQKYIPFEQDGKTLYKNTSVYSGWTLNNKDNYHPVTVIFKQQTRKEHIVEFNKNQLKFGGDSSSEITSSTASVEPTTKKADPPTPSENSSEPAEKPIIKVKSFAVVPEEETKTPAKPIVEETSTPEPPQAAKINTNYASGSFLVLRTDAANLDPPLWKIDGKALLQKYAAFNQNGKTLYKNSAEYSGWSLKNKKNYFPVTTTFRQQNKKDHIVELNRIKWDEPDESEKED